MVSNCVKLHFFQINDKFKGGYLFKNVLYDNKMA